MACAQFGPHQTTPMTGVRGFCDPPWVPKHWFFVCQWSGDPTETKKTAQTNYVSIHNNFSYPIVVLLPHSGPQAEKTDEKMIIIWNKLKNRRNGNFYPNSLRNHHQSLTFSSKTSIKLLTSLSITKANKLKTIPGNLSLHLMGFCLRPVPRWTVSLWQPRL